MNRLLYSFLSALILLLGSCQTTQSQNVLIPQEFSAKMLNTAGATILDVRTPSEFKDGHLPQSINIDWNSEGFNKNVQVLDKTKPVFVYCHSGRRSEAAAKYMRKEGFLQVYELAGGIDAWMTEDMPLGN